MALESESCNNLKSDLEKLLAVRLAAFGVQHWYDVDRLDKTTFDFLAKASTLHTFHCERDFANMLTEFATVSIIHGSTSRLRECSSSCGGCARGTAIVNRAWQWNAI